MNLAEKVQALADRLQIDRPLVWFDYETTSKYPALARIVQIGLIKVWPDRRPARVWESLINPGEPIPAEATETHGIRDEDVAGAPNFRSIASSLVRGFADCHFGGYNIRYDLKVTVAECKRCGIPWSYDHAQTIDGFRLWQTLPGEQRSLTDAVRIFAGRSLEGAHGAMPDCEGAIDAVLGMLDAAGDSLPKTWAELQAHCNPPDPSRIDREGKLVWHNGEAHLNFGKYEGWRLQDVDHGFCRWVLRGDFSQEVKEHFANAIRGIYPCSREQ